MAKQTGFLDYRRADDPVRDAALRTKDYDEFHRQLPEQERIEQCGRCMNCGVPYCQTGIRMNGKLFGCPLHNLIPEWNDLAWMKEEGLAVSRLLKTNCFPEFTGRVCPAPCEDACLCARASGASVSIRENELAIIEKAFTDGLIQAKKQTSSFGGSVAVVGSGPSGLAAAWFLAARGHRVVVYEKDHLPGGLLTYGIPEMKLPQWVVARRIRLMEDNGVTFVTDTKIRSLKKLKQDYDCVLLACGARKSRQLRFENDTLPGVTYALDYLTASSRQLLGETKRLPQALDAKDRDVVVIGAGDSASDCVATAIRQGCRTLRQLIRKPASFYEGKPQGYAQEEAAARFPEDIRMFETTVSAAHPDEKSGSLASLTLKTADGTKDIPCSLMIIASGFSGPEKDAESLARQADDKVFLAGDMKNGASLVCLAIQDGKEAADAIDRCLTGFSPILLR